MARPKNPVPTYRLHKPSGTARCWVGGKWVMLGKFNSPESRAEYARICAEHAAAPAAATASTVDLTLDQVIYAFWNYAQQHYRRPDGSLTSEVTEYRIALGYLRRLYGQTIAREFGPLGLKAVRHKMIEAGLCRSTFNNRIRRLKHAFKWAVDEQLIPVSIYQSLTCVAGLQRGRTPAPEAIPIGPVDDGVVGATLPYLNRFVRAMVEVQRLTGMRPGEVVVMRRADIDTGGEVWIFRPLLHKNAHRGKPRAVAIGPKAQEIIRPFLTMGLNDYLFSPRRAVEEQHAERAAKRVTPRYASHMRHNSKRRTNAPKRPPAERYTSLSYARAIERACDKLYPPPEHLARRKGETPKSWRKRLTADERKELKAWFDSYRWSPNQLRHTFASHIRKQHGWKPPKFYSDTARPM